MEYKQGFEWSQEGTKIKATYRPPTKTYRLRLPKKNTYILVTSSLPYDINPDTNGKVSPTFSFREDSIGYSFVTQKAALNALAALRRLDGCPLQNEPVQIVVLVSKTHIYKEVHSDEPKKTRKRKKK